MTVRIAILGNGFARTVMLPALRNVPGAEVVGISSPSQERLRSTAEEFGIPVHGPHPKAMIRECRPDAVFIATPPHVHCEAAIHALEAGCHVLCEKPTALDAGESARMWEAARSNPNRLALIDHELRFDPRRVQMREWAEAGRFGEVRRASYRLHSTAFRVERPWSWWSDADRGGGALGAIGSHAVDALRVVLGEVVEVRGHLDRFSQARIDPETGSSRPVTSDEFVVAWLRFESGAIATLEVSMVEVERRHEFSIVGSRGAARVVEQGPLTAVFDAAFVDGEAPVPVDIEDDLPSHSEMSIPDTDWARSFVRYGREIVAAIEGGRSSVPHAATFEDGHRNQCVLDAIRRSSEHGRWVICRP